MSKVLVTGASGFIGQYVVEQLLRDGRTVVAFDHHAKGDLPKGVELFHGDIRSATDVTEAFAHVDSFIHLAGVLGTAEAVQNPRPAAETNILGGLNVLEAAAQYKLPGVNIAVGNYWMNNTYSITKNSVERFVDMFNTNRGTEISVVRALNAYGPRQIPATPYGPSKVRKIMPALICRALQGDPVEIYGTGDQVMDMIYVADVAKVLTKALYLTEQNGPLPITVEAGTGLDTTVNDIAKVVVDTIGQGEIVHLPMRQGEPEKSIVLGDVRTLEAVNVDPKDLVTLRDGVERAVNYFREYLNA